MVSSCKRLRGTSLVRIYCRFYGDEDIGALEDD